MPVTTMRVSVCATNLNVYSIWLIEDLEDRTRSPYIGIKSRKIITHIQYKTDIKHCKSMNHYAAKKLTKATAKIEQD
jgi:hypothetical protein